jgi:hypothetical protein
MLIQCTAEGVDARNFKKRGAVVVWGWVGLKTVLGNGLLSFSAIFQCLNVIYFD